MTSDSSDERTCPACGNRYPSVTRFCPSDGQPLRDTGESCDALIGSLVADRYYVERRLGTGGMGVVYLAQHVYMSRACALKVMRGEFLARTDALTRFTRGAQNASRIQHPNVAAIYDFGEIEGESMYLAMEYVDGLTLGAVIDRDGPLPLARCITILSQVASALRTAHDLGIVHRDLKPDNIMLAPSVEGDDLVKVVDFGIARALFDDAQRVTQSDAMVGTPAYMSPEQLRGRPADTRSDLYSLGLVTIAMLTGEIPHSSDPVDLALRFMQRPRRLRELRPSIDWPPTLQQVLDRALASDPGDRQQNVTQFAREFIDAVRLWQPAEVTIVTAALSRLGVDMSLALPPEAIVRIGTPSDARVLPSVDSGFGRGMSQGPVPVTSLATSEPAGVSSVAAPLLPVAGPQAPSSLRLRKRSVTLALGGLAITSMIVLAVFLAPGDWRGLGSGGLRLATDDLTPTPATGSTPVAPPAMSPLDSARRGVYREQEVADATPAPSDSTRRPPSTREGNVGNDARRTSLARPDVARAENPASVSPGGQAATVASDSAGAGGAVGHALPNVGMIRIGSGGAIGAALYVNDRLIGVVSTLRTVRVAPGAVRIRLSIERCQDWDSTIMIARGDTVSIGYRRPLCPP